MKEKYWVVLWPPHRDMGSVAIPGLLRYRKRECISQAVLAYGHPWKRLYAMGHRAVPCTVSFNQPRVEVTDKIERSLHGLDRRNQ